MSESLAIVDAHVHFHACFPPEPALDAAWRHFVEVAEGRPFTGVLMLAEPRDEAAFPALRAADWSRWRLEPGDDRISCLAHRIEDGASLLLLQGYQIPTSESLEVLCLGCDVRPGDRADLSRVVGEARDRGALAVIPWGAGKWLGRRGAVLSHYLESLEDPGVFLGDNGGRPRAWHPHHFDLGARRGVRVLPGSDPLPMRSEWRRLGSFGFSLPAALPERGGARALIERLERADVHPTPFGRSEYPIRFLRNQIAMQWRLRVAAGGS